MSVDFRKGARDLWEEPISQWFDYPLSDRQEKEEECARENVVRDLEAALRRMHAEGVAEAAEIANRIIRAANAGLVPPDDGAPTPRELLNNVANEIAAALFAPVADVPGKYGTWREPGA